MLYKVTIETRRMEDGSFRAYAVKGPLLMQGLRAEAGTRREAYLAARVALQTAFLKDTFSFIHAEA